MFAYDSNSQAIPTPGTFTTVRFLNGAGAPPAAAMPVSNGWTQNTAGTQFTCNQTGIYLISYELVLQISAGLLLSNVTVTSRATTGASPVEIPGTQTHSSFSSIALGGTQASSNGCTFLLSATVGQIIGIQATGSSATSSVDASGAGTLPISAMLTIHQLA